MDLEKHVCCFLCDRALSDEERVLVVTQVGIKLPVALVCARCFTLDAEAWRRRAARRKISHLRLTPYGAARDFS